ncbi:MAG: hypothetical protein NVSMB47_15010 [Polyangiales bacterium]
MPAMPVLDVDAGWSLLSPEPAPALDAELLRRQAKRFFAAELGAFGPFAIDVLDVLGHTTRVAVTTCAVGDAPELLDASHAAMAALGGSGFQHLVARAVRVWQFASTPLTGDDERAPLLLAAVTSSVLLAPIVAPGGSAIFGVKTARERLEKAGWRT